MQLLVYFSYNQIILSIKLFKALDKIKKPFNEKLPMAKFAWTVTEDTDTVSIIFA